LRRPAPGSVGSRGFAMIGVLIGDWQREGDGRAASDFRSSADLPAVGFDQALGYGQPKPRASGLGAWHGQEAVEEAREMFRGNAVPRVDDGD
jgi:hypothetical protein